MDKFFKISERGSSVRTEIFAGLTTFFAMCYIVVVNPAQVAAGGAGGWLAELGADTICCNLETINEDVFYQRKPVVLSS